MDHRRRSSLNFFAAHRLDRAAARRRDDAWILARLADPGTRVVPVWRSRKLVSGGEARSPVLLAPAILGPPEVLAEHAVLLGESGGQALFAVELTIGEDEVGAQVPAHADFHELREIGALLAACRTQDCSAMGKRISAHLPGRFRQIATAILLKRPTNWPRTRFPSRQAPEPDRLLEREDAALLAYARALLRWHRRHRFCGDCGAPTSIQDGSHQRACSAPGCGARHFPRTDPAIIVLVVAPGGADRDAERCLLGRQSIWPERMYSTIAGFVEPGESLEDAVVREVDEETGIEVGDVHYHSSQPWPFPSSLVLGFTASALTDRIVRFDEELEDARWVTRAGLVGAMASGELRLPRRVSIAFRLIQDWFDEGSLGPLEARL